MTPLLSLSPHRNAKNQAGVLTRTISATLQFAVTDTQQVESLSLAPEAQQTAHALYEPAHDSAAHHLPKAHAVQPQAPDDQRQALKGVWRPAAARHAKLCAAACRTARRFKGGA